MAIQDDNTILNKGDLKAYHEAIAPMLGGTFMVRTNNSDYYSTDEKIVGVWTDGKPIYQKTIIPSTNYGAGNFVILANAKTVLSIDQVVNIIGVETASSNGATFSLTENTTDYIGYDGTDFVLRKGNTGTTWIVKATFQYTKTTDVAGSATTTPGAYDINFPNTWPENKEIYLGNGLYGQRFTGTYACSAASSSWNQSPTANLKLLSTSKAYHIVQQGGGAARNNGTFLPLVGTDSDANLALAFWCGTDGIYLRAKDNNTNTNNYNIWCTYTK